MLLKVNDLDKYNISVTNTCGNSLSIIDRFLQKNFGSSKYELINLTNILNINQLKFPDSKKVQTPIIDLKNYSDTIYLNFDLRSKGLVFYFRYKNTEYIEFCDYSEISFKSDNNMFFLKTVNFSYKFRIIQMNKHREFLEKLNLKQNN